MSCNFRIRFIVALHLHETEPLKTVTHIFGSLLVFPRSKKSLFIAMICLSRTSPHRMFGRRCYLNSWTLEGAKHTDLSLYLCLLHVNPVSLNFEIPTACAVQTNHKSSHSSGKATLQGSKYKNKVLMSVLPQIHAAKGAERKLESVWTLESLMIPSNQYLPSSGTVFNAQPTTVLPPWQLPDA